MEVNELSRICKTFCERPAPMDGLTDVIRAYPYFQIARLMACYGHPESEAAASMAFRMEDRAFLYRFMKGELRLEEEESVSAIEAVTASIPKEINSENGRSAIQVLDDMLEKFKTNKISPYPTEDAEDEPYEDLGKSSNMERMNFVSETLARLYVEQKEYDRAIKVYRVLMEKQPEKEALYAEAVESVKAMKGN